VIREDRQQEAIMTVKLTRNDLPASELRRAAAKSADASAARRMLAIALILDGHSRQDAAQQCGMDRQTLRDWVHRYNAEGLAGLSDRPHAGGPKPALSNEQLAQVAAWVRTGPEPEKDGVIRWRRIDLRDKIAVAFAVRLHERSVGKQLRRLGFRCISVRPRHPQADAVAQEAHKKTLPPSLLMQSQRPRVAGRLNSGGRMRHASVSREL
jgi:transposase